MPVRHGATRVIRGSAVLRRLAVVLAAAVLALLSAAPEARAASAWQRPVPGEVVRPFDYSAGRPFAAGAHRGVDLAARLGTRVRAACAGRVSHAGDVAGHGGVVTVLCGAFSVTYLPLAGIAVRSGERVARGSPLGTVASGHGGLHVGLRRAGHRFAYEDPMTRIADPALPVPGLLPHGRAPAPRLPVPSLPAPSPGPPRAPAPRPHAGAPPAPAPRLHAPAAPSSPPPLDRRAHTPDLRADIRPLRAHPPGHLARTPASPHRPGEPAPWPVWAGAALVLAGCAGSGATAARRRRTAGPAHVLAARSAG